MTSPKDCVWSRPGANALLLRMAAVGASGREIQEALHAEGFKVSRSAVMGRAHRLGLRIGGEGTAALAAHQKLAREQDRRARAAERDRICAERAAARSRSRKERAREAAARAERVAERKRAGLPHLGRPAGRSPHPGTVAARPPLPVPRDVAQGGMPFLATQAENCRYGLRGDGADLIVCGARVAPGRPYCPAHVRLCYVPLQTHDVRAPTDLASRAPRRSREDNEADLVDLLAEAA